ncbi:MAG: hypothetical protein Hyperionvirus4_6 [Hyperionvirus sp.]|uniref:Uncharacterized protein n=1 Tax=Hyperionvirus sp. TaxID=2487770 RepID=A0A3G5AA16_9VIRU|nr:MAG: hypothetical protein Hyperionvirus4_6 [Hyperionvirus sp.]
MKNICNCSHDNVTNCCTCLNGNYNNENDLNFICHQNNGIFNDLTISEFQYSDKIGNEADNTFFDDSILGGGEVTLLPDEISDFFIMPEIQFPNLTDIEMAFNSSTPLREEYQLRIDLTKSANVLFVNQSLVVGINDPTMRTYTNFAVPYLLYTNNPAARLASYAYIHFNNLPNAKDFIIRYRFNNLNQYGKNNPSISILKNPGPLPLNPAASRVFYDEPFDTSNFSVHPISDQSRKIEINPNDFLYVRIDYSSDGDTTIGPFPKNDPLVFSIQVFEVLS